MLNNQIKLAMENKIDSEKLFAVLEPRMYHQIMWALNYRIRVCQQNLATALDMSHGDLNDDSVCYWSNELKEVEYTYNRMP